MNFRVTASRAFAGVGIILICAYGYFAFFEISAPIQYDPLGPEGWPKFLAIVGLLLSVSILRDAGDPAALLFDGTTKQVLIAAAMLSVYAWVFEWLGFALSTTLFCAGLAGLMGARGTRALLFGVLLGVGQYVIAVHVLGLNLPIGEIFVTGAGP